MKTNDGLYEYLSNKLGSPYWYGGFGQVATPELEAKLRATFPNVWHRAGDVSKDYGSYIFDSAGIIKGYIWDTDHGATYNQSQDISCFGFYIKAKKKGTTSDFPAANGTLLYQSINGKKIGINHIGVYFNGYVFEAKPGEGVVKSYYRVQDWPFWSDNFLIDG